MDRFVAKGSYAIWSHQSEVGFPQVVAGRGLRLVIVTLFGVTVQITEGNALVALGLGKFLLKLTDGTMQPRNIKYQLCIFPFKFQLLRIR